jgi:arylformamidase
MSQEELDREYSPSSRAPNFVATLDRYAKESARAREDLDYHADLAYGPGSAELLDFFPPVRVPAPLQVFVHGGHWQQMSKEDSCFAASALVERGAAFVALGYGLAPEHSLDSMVASVRRALWWLREHAEELGSHPDTIFASGSSAGAHLVAMALCDTAEQESDPPPVAGASLLSGVYDLEPVRLSYVNDRVGMDEATAFGNSPLYHLPCATSQVIMARGVAETTEYARQHTDFVRALGEHGHSVVDLVVTARNHFDLPLDLGRRDTVLGRSVLAQMRL